MLCVGQSMLSVKSGNTEVQFHWEKIQAVKFQWKFKWRINLMNTVACQPKGHVQGNICM